MRGVHLDDLTVDGVCRGLDPADAPPGYQLVARALLALRDQPGCLEPGEPDRHILAALAATTHDRWRLSKRPGWSVKVAVSVAAGLLSLSGVAAAAAGVFAPSTAAHPVLPTTPVPGSPASGRSDPAAGGLVSSTTAPSEPNSIGLAVTGNFSAVPTAVACASGANHGQYVSSVAHNPSAGGEGHGDVVSAAAQSTCGKPVTSIHPVPTTGGGPSTPGRPPGHQATATNKPKLGAVTAKRGHRRG